jgi:hypothetical protein
MSNQKIMLKNVRLSFPSIFKRANFNGEEGKFEATFLLDKEEHAKEIAQLNSAIEAAIKEAKIKVPSDKRCVKDGDDVDYDGYANCMSIKASSNKRVTVIDRDKSPLAEEDGKPYGGCYVNAIVGLWVQNNNYGKRVNANLLGVQFAKDGTPFGAGDIDVTDDFDAFDDDEFNSDDPFA